MEPQILQGAFRRALILAAEAATLGEIPVGAVILQDERIVGEGANRRETTPDPVAHAEIIALRSAAQTLGAWRLTRCTLVVTLEPCIMCLSACQQARIEDVFFGALDPKGGSLSLGYHAHRDPRTHHRFNVQYRANAECGHILSDFFRARRAARVTSL